MCNTYRAIIFEAQALNPGTLPQNKKTLQQQKIIYNTDSGWFEYAW